MPSDSRLVEEAQEPSLRGVRRGGRRGNLNSLGNSKNEIAALPLVAPNDEKWYFFNKPTPGAVHSEAVSFLPATSSCQQQVLAFLIFLIIIVGLGSEHSWSDPKVWRF